MPSNTNKSAKFLAEQEGKIEQVISDLEAKKISEITRTATFYDVENDTIAATFKQLPTPPRKIDL